LYDYINQKDHKTTTISHGFRVTAYIIKDANGNVIEKEVKPHGKALAEHIPGILKRVLGGNGLSEINQDALDFIRRRTSEILEYFENHNTRSITGSSVLILIDNISKSYEMKIIDLSHFIDFEDTNQRDTGYILGLKNLIKFLNEL
jgi:hypothetical protein